MNLRKDHYRSFTRTLCTVVVSSGLGRPLVGRPSLAHPASAASRFASCALASRLVAPPARVRFAVWRGAPRLDTRNHTTLVDGYLGMSNDEERSEMRYVVRIAEFSESSNL